MTQVFISDQAAPPSPVSLELNQRLGDSLEEVVLEFQYWLSNVLQVVVRCKRHHSVCSKCTISVHSEVGRNTQAFCVLLWYTYLHIIKLLCAATLLTIMIFGKKVNTIQYQVVYTCMHYDYRIAEQIYLHLIASGGSHNWCDYVIWLMYVKYYCCMYHNCMNSVGICKKAIPLPLKTCILINEGISLSLWNCILLVCV